ncbi:hypothetical protein PB1_02950 [Bacillus methanolicus PB1]|uniref:Uncharacterized protein n=1 Tax=Bacillus methanolicus PB1 TaxID=997296 RepID=I3E5U2_BACMT|nr:hypothetical protein [Bacillus methanolicus]EIJ81863.1 hypothetical protein PB1_02950 [Bacillus methanolicus PB1]
MEDSHKENPEVKSKVNESKDIPEIDEEEDDPFTRFMFGPRRRPSERKTQNNHSKNTVDQIDYMLLMENIDMLLDSAKQLKPLLNKITPFINQFIKKNK